MDPTSILTWILSVAPPSWRPAIGSACFLIAATLALAAQLRKHIKPPAVGSRWVIPYRVLSALAGASGWAAPIYDVGMTAVRTTRSSAPALKAAAEAQGIPVISSKSKGVPTAPANVVSSIKPGK